MPRRYRSGRRAEAVEETRRRILEATLQLHGEQGILATSWDQIARRAGVSLATVYRHFPSLDALVPACGAVSEEYIRPPRRELAGSLFEGVERMEERVERLVTELCAFYERGGIALATAAREGHVVEPLGSWAREMEDTRAALVRAAVPGKMAEAALRVATALTGYAVWRALLDAGVPAAEAPRVIRSLVLSGLTLDEG